MNRSASNGEKADCLDTAYWANADVHCHISDREQTELMLQRAGLAGVRRIILTGTCPADFPLIGQLAQQSAQQSAEQSALNRRLEIRTAFGLHPWKAAQWNGTAGTLKETLDEAFCRYSGPFGSGIGEIGLDFALRRINAEQKNRQREIFHAQLGYAAAKHLPVILHTVRAAGAVIESLEQRGPFRLILMHQFCAGADQIRQLAGQNAYFSYHLPETGKIAEKLEQAVQSVPEERLLLETDWPSGLEPEQLRGSLCRMARIRRTVPEKMANILTNNAGRFFADWDNTQTESTK